MKRAAPTFTGAYLKAWRTSAGLTQGGLASRVGLHVQTVKYWERQAIVSVKAARLFEEGFALSRAPRPSRLTVGNADLKTADIGAARESLKTDAQQTRKQSRPRCGARTRRGTDCQAQAITGKRRCRLHGGMSTGPRTPEGRQRISEAATRRWTLAKAKATTHA